jgi:hypothetical protein
VIDLQRLGARAAAPSAAGVDAHFAILLPGIEPGDGYDVGGRVIHTEDRFAPDVSARTFSLVRVADDPDGLCRPRSASTRGQAVFGRSNTYLYRYQLLGGAGQWRLADEWPFTA